MHACTKIATASFSFQAVQLLLRLTNAFLEMDNFVEVFSSFTNITNLISITVLTICLALAVTAVKLFRMRWKYQKELNDFVVAKERHWLFGHLHMASISCITS